MIFAIIDSMTLQLITVRFSIWLYKTKTPAFFLAAFLVLSSCISSHQPVERFQEKENNRKELIETILTKEHGDSVYQSLAFGPLTVYKPESFRELDSLYALKDDFIERNDLRGLKTSGVEDKIPAYRAEAQNDVDKVEYEIEHIFSLEYDDSFNISHTFFLFNHEDSLLSQDKLYSYTLPSQYKKMHNKYLFEYHFITSRDLYISRDEMEFIQFYKKKERQLAGTEELDSFMVNTMKTMELAQNINSVDYRELIKYRSIENLKPLGGDITINEFGTLIALKDENERIVGYEYTIRWHDNANNIKKKSIFSYSPTLTLEGIETTKE